MKKLLIVNLVITAFSLSSLAETKEEFCSRFISPTSLAEHLSKKENRLSFDNFAGKLDMGVCWWHSRLQRKAAYLAIFKPELNKPTAEEFKKISKKLVYGSDIVEIPGFRNLNEIKDKDYISILENEISNQQIREAFLRMIWLKNKIGGYKNGLNNIDKELEDIKETLASGNIPYLLLRPKKMMNTHAWLVTGIEETDQGCHKLSVIDSNYQDETLERTVCPGQLFDLWRGPTAVYVMFEHELKKIRKSAEKFCQ